MNSVILCEGETDQILLSYYFCECFGFKYCNEALPVAPKKLNPGNHAETICCYARDNDNLIIWAVGGHDDLFVKAMEKILRQNKINSPRNGQYSRICVMTDHDSDTEVEAFENKMNQCLSEKLVSGGLQKLKWVQANQDMDFGTPLPMRLLELIVPATETGALETVLLNALAEKDENEYVVQESRKTIKNLMENKDKYSSEYLSDRRSQVKAPLAVFLAIAAPERTFVETDKILKNIPWREYQAIHDLFQPLDQFCEEGTNVS